MTECTKEKKGFSQSRSTKGAKKRRMAGRRRIAGMRRLPAILLFFAPFVLLLCEKPFFSSVHFTRRRDESRLYGFA
ncbi:MAG: hypothetical protein AVDCRST_MAG56-8035 [uncultured Cytophagales bacterium]|uniref:Uncharacterized protein n=1 Tax=uncultured Cytophagales bacterium TaxID=158755 RepID=A0A6J4LZH3_9SPHI|nr:MAG: hypothetical protein AVDCRST_MAG56-8035 [uncultured Cytophagales bacterium]